MASSIWPVHPGNRVYGEYGGRTIASGSATGYYPPVSRPTELVYPPGFNSLCPACSFLAGKYGPDDQELFVHCQNYFGRKQLSDPNHYYPGDSTNPNLNENHAAN